MGEPRCSPGRAHTNSVNPRSVHNLQLQFCFCYVVLYWGLQLIYNVLCRPNVTTGKLGTRCGYVYKVTIRLKDHAHQLWCVVPIPQSTTWTNVKPTLIHCLVYAGSSSLCHVICDTQSSERELRLDWCR